ncbi:hypothetical protein DJ010_09320 [Nocardioides silvaticus]|uniref:Uncharacterized protein n=1 Tax=Nocardioides silvaticus TaxID=2201891 RepID=A0A316TFK5_9ACTN|nr:hypothetical protein [Nocardioides silvaticus]PWN03303.1 hypothetical protein DJ010_09320 [Nocardioides silvaticus]
MSEKKDEQEGQVSEVSAMEGDEADTPIVDGDATSGYPDSESGDAQEPGESGPNADPHRDIKPN